MPSGTVSFHTDRGRSYEQTLPPAGTGSIEWSTTASDALFARVQVRHPDGRMAALTNPILLN